tara:strand:- start:3273 stop:4187 length:915 start_codon:yes stop_codon:yes gene_type:complete
MKRFPILQLQHFFRTCAGAGLFALTLAGPSTAQVVPPGDLPFGVYDPNGDFTDLKGVQIEHLFLPWEDVLLPSLFEAETYAKERDRTLLVTIEPWTWSRDERNSPKVLQTGIEAGTYDETMRTVCAALGQLEIPMTIRWAQEMDDKSGQFIWAGWKPESYVSAYRRMNKICRAMAPEAKFMWSPLGYENMADYYPGDDFVDMVGLSVFSHQPWEEAILGESQSFADILGPRYERAMAFGKPIMVAELGFIGNAEHVAQWNADVRSMGATFPALTGVVYFDQKEVYPWPDDFGLPNWRQTENVLE